MAPPSALLEVVAGKAAGMSIVVDDELVVGRNAEGAGKLAEDGELSRSHARIALDGNGFCAVEDLGSTNGTFVNGLRITTPQTLSRRRHHRARWNHAGGARHSHPRAGHRPLPRCSPSGSALAPAESEAAAPASELPETAPPEPEPDAPGAPEPKAPRPPAPPPPRAPEPPSAGASVAAPTPASGAPTLQLEVDFSAQQVRLRVGDADEPLLLVCEDGTWRPAQDAATTERDSA